MNIVVIDYGSGNLRSAAKALEFAAEVAGESVSVIISSDPNEVKKADKIVLPGQGAFGDSMSGLTEPLGLLDSLNDAVHGRAVPFLGICVGMQLMSTGGLEYGYHKGLGWLGGTVRRIRPKDQKLKIPHMGWNNLLINNPHPILNGIKSGTHCYFVHSFAYESEDSGEVIACIDYGGTVTAAIAKENMVGMQFHPDKSQAAGIQILANFIVWKP